LSGSPHPDLLVEFYVGAPALPVSSEPDIHSVSVEKFYSSDGASLSTEHPLTKAAMLYLTEVWPRSVSFKTLVAEAHARLNGAPIDFARDVGMLGASLLDAYGHSDNLVELRVSEPRFVLEISDRPVASSVARSQAQRGPLVTNLRHERVKLTGLAHCLLPHLDGSQDRAALVGLLEKWVAEGVVELQPDGAPDENEGTGAVPHPPGETDLAEMLESRLRQIARAALLMG
jgi:hypothetical protein